MSRLGMLYAISDQEVQALQQQRAEDRYDYMLGKIEEVYYDSSQACALDKAWEGLQYCFCNGQWLEENIVPANIIFGGDVLLDWDDHVITLKTPAVVAQIVAYLEQHDLKKIIEENFCQLDAEAYSLPKDETNMHYLFHWGKEICAFYKTALNHEHYVIFTVDL